MVWKPHDMVVSGRGLSHVSRNVLGEEEGGISVDLGFSDLESHRCAHACTNTNARTRYD